MRGSHYVWEELAGLRPWGAGKGILDYSETIGSLFGSNPSNQICRKFTVVGSYHLFVDFFQGIVQKKQSISIYNEWIIVHNGNLKKNSIYNSHVFSRFPHPLRWFGSAAAASYQVKDRSQLWKLNCDEEQRVVSWSLVSRSNALMWLGDCSCVCCVDWPRLKGAVDKLVKKDTIQLPSQPILVPFRSVERNPPNHWKPGSTSETIIINTDHWTATSRDDAEKKVSVEIVRTFWHKKKVWTFER